MYPAKLPLKVRYLRVEKDFKQMKNFDKNDWTNVNAARIDVFRNVHTGRFVWKNSYTVKYAGQIYTKIALENRVLDCLVLGWGGGDERFGPHGSQVALRHRNRVNKIKDRFRGNKWRCRHQTFAYECAVAEFIDPWLGDKVDSGTGLSYRPASPCSLPGRYDNLMPESNLSPQLGSMNSATGELGEWRGGGGCTEAKF